MAVTGIEETTKQAPLLRGGSTEVRNWISGMMAVVLHLREVSTTIRERWGFTRYVDLPPYPGISGGCELDPMPEHALVLEKTEIEVLKWARRTLEEALEWASYSDSSGKGASVPLRVVGAEVQSVNDERDEYITKRFEIDKAQWKTIVKEVNDNKSWSPLASESAARKAYVAYCKRKGKTPVTRKQWKIDRN
jgi:hypothetical protein